ncbi:Rad4-domain-containing protein [Byssothecium circinans]|uniref:Rad4-domain-containing protein n=1 Tax=Byssothecium circinans TaxID=147558 RepID=A0A6A5U5Y8_9PLEO|nr:Rad4-domain-containing protein [Byssothecium circinans]
MPPILSRKRVRSESPKPDPQSKRAKPRPHPRRSKESVFNALDTPPTVSRSLSETKKFLEEGDDESDLSDDESSGDVFEDVPIAAQDVESGESEDEEWEDALGTKHHTKHADEPDPVISGDLQLILSEPAQAVHLLKPDGKKRPSKIQRQIRNVTHCMHVQFLMWHNTIRNAWIQDQQVQKIMVDNMTTGCWREVDKYWRDVGIRDGPKSAVAGGWTKNFPHDIVVTGILRNSSKTYESWKKREGETLQSSGKAGPSKDQERETRSDDRNQRDWGSKSSRLEPETPNLSAGDPLLRLLEYLSAFWKAKFNITAPCLRKRGYLSPATLQAEVLAWKTDSSDADAFGERIEDLEAFRELARKCHGSCDVGQQLFTALLRGLGIEARMVASLQPVGFAFSQAEEGKAVDLQNLTPKANAINVNNATPTYIKGDLQNNSHKGGTKDTSINLSNSEISDLSSAISISSDSEATSQKDKKTSKIRKYGNELPRPTYWTEAISNLTHTPVCVSCLPRTVIATSSMPEQLSNFYCRGAPVDKAKQVFAYLIAYSSDGSAKDVTTRYLPQRQWPGKTKGYRMPAEKIPIHNKRGKVKRWEEWDWFKSVMRPYARPFNRRQPWDEVEDEGDLVPAKPAKPKDMDEEGGKETLQGYKNSTKHVLERHLRREEAVKPGASIVRYFVTGKGDKEKAEPVYRRKDIVVCKSVESWHKEGREVKEGEQPLKYVPMRAVTVIRKREIEEREREEGEKVKQGLYAQSQTDWIIPDPIVDGKVPRNSFGNIDVYVPTMIPKGAVHIPLKGTARICRKLNIDHAEACTGFEFGKQRAVPVLTGVVVASENEDMVIDAWEADQAEKAAKEADKKEKLILGLWKKFFVGLRTVQRLKREYGEDVELPQTTVRTMNRQDKKSEWETFKDHQDFEGGFVREGPSAAGGFLQQDEDMAGGFFTASQGEEERVPMGEMTVDHGDMERLGARNFIAENANQTPISFQSMHERVLDENEPTANGHEEAESEKEALTPSTSGRKRHSAQPTRSSGRGRGSNSTSTTTYKYLLRSNSPDSRLSSVSPSPSDVGPDDEDDDEPRTKRGKKRKAVPPPPEVPKRSIPKRKVAMKGEKQVKSHFFAHGTDDETDLTDLTDRSPVKKGSGREGGGKDLAILLYPAANWNLEEFMDDTKNPFYFGRVAPASQTSTTVGQYKVYITDFGIARAYQSPVEAKTDSPTSYTRTYAALEVVDQDKRSSSADMFSLSCVFMEILTTMLSKPE